MDALKKFGEHLESMDVPSDGHVWIVIKRTKQSSTRFPNNPTIADAFGLDEKQETTFWHILERRSGKQT